jgi:hypothetical protein
MDTAAWGVKLTIHLHLVLRLRVRELYLHFPIFNHAVHTAVLHFPLQYDAVLRNLRLSQIIYVI